MGRETLIKATVAGSLEWDIHEQAVDRITALALSRNAIGSAMIHADGLDAQSLRKVVFLVVRKLNHRYRLNRGFGEKIVLAALKELMQPHCPTCNGKGEIHNEGEAVVGCQSCSGTGLHRYSDSVRAELIGGSLHGKAYSFAIASIRDAVSVTVLIANNRLTNPN